MTRDLDKVGIPLCKGNVMATNPVWRKSATQWRDQISQWCRRQSFVALRFSDILVDSFKAISRLRDRVRSEFTGDIF